MNANFRRKLAFLFPQTQSKPPIRFQIKNEINWRLEDWVGGIKTIFKKNWHSLYLVSAISNGISGANLLGPENFRDRGYGLYLRFTAVEKVGFSNFKLFGNSN
jgi:hypothetical protein